MRTALGLLVVMSLACSDASKNGTSLGGGASAGAGAGGRASSSAGAGGTAGNSSGRGGSSGAAPDSRGGAAGGTASGGVPKLSLPRVYPPVRAATPTLLIADSSYAALPFQSGQVGTARQALEGAVNLATAVRERFYSTGPTDLLRIVSELDGRLQGLDLDVAAHPCLSTAPVLHSYVLPGGQSFEVKLQCLQRFGAPGASAGWLGFGVEHRQAADAGVAAASPGGSADASVSADAGSSPTDAGSALADGDDFYLIEGQEGGNGGAYHIDPHGNIEAWIAVAERAIPANSQVIMHLWTDQAAHTLELALAGSAVGFCAAHLKTDPDALFVSGKTNAPPPPGTEQAVGTQYCDGARAGCFRADDLSTDLGSGSASCARIGPSSFDVAVELDSDTSADAGTNVVTSEIYGFFNQMPTGVPDF